MGFGGYSGENEGGIDLIPSFVGLGGNLTLMDFVFAEGHVGSVGEGTGLEDLLELHLKDS